MRLTTNLSRSQTFFITLPHVLVSLSERTLAIRPVGDVSRRSVFFNGVPQILILTYFCRIFCKIQLLIVILIVLFIQLLNSSLEIR